jgi:peptidyl-tRNA hydrolase, PTH2 family
MDIPAAKDSLGIGTVIATSFVTFVSGMLFGIYAVRGYILSPSVVEERRKAFTDPVESDESDIDEAAGPLDHAPNWANRAEADRRDGLRARRAPADSSSQPITEECKLVLVVRSDLAMGKGESFVPRVRHLPRVAAALLKPHRVL